MTTVRIAAAQTSEFREDVDAALDYLAETAVRAVAEGVLGTYGRAEPGRRSRSAVASGSTGAAGLRPSDLPTTRQ
jgi:hypothetical protein